MSFLPLGSLESRSLARRSGLCFSGATSGWIRDNGHHHRAQSLGDKIFIGCLVVSIWVSIGMSFGASLCYSRAFIKIVQVLGLPRKSASALCRLTFLAAHGP
jgi:hypothetical protein